MTEKEEYVNVPLQIIKEKVLINLDNYQKVMTLMLGDAPIGVLCLPKVIENALSSDGCVRVYDIFNRDLTKIKGLGTKRIGELTSRLDEFLSMG
mgnify:CR=1 FL=1